jgi:hypothetical protein
MGADEETQPIYRKAVPLQAVPELAEGQDTARSQLQPSTALHQPHRHLQTTPSKVSVSQCLVW